MSTLENLRKRSGLLVTIIGLALGAFVLTSLFENNSFSGQESSVGEIAGKAIEYRDFNARAQQAIENVKQNEGKRSLTEAETNDILQQVWNQIISEEVLDKEYEKLGIIVSDDELYDLMVNNPHPALLRNITDPQTGRVVEAFADPQTGRFSPAKIVEYTQNMNAEQEAQWAQMENYIRKTRVIEKYNNLVKKGIYVTQAEAKKDFVAQNTNASIKYVVQRYSSIPDSTVTVDDSDLRAYYNEHQNNYKQETSRKIEYVAFPIIPSKEDIEKNKAEFDEVVKNFRDITPEQDSLFVIAESDSRLFDENYYGKGMLSPQIEEIMFTQPIGTVVGPYEENRTLKASKLVATKMVADSAKVRHILIAYQGSGASATTLTREQAKEKADSLLTLLKKGASFKDFVEKHSDDGGKNGEEGQGKNGEYGWINKNSSFVPSFKNAGLDNKKGSLVVVESNLGYHIIEVLDSKGSNKEVRVATIERKLEPSSKTLQGIFLAASKFAGENTTNELFQNAVMEQKLTKRVADNIKETNQSIPGIESSRSLVRWVYENNKGTVSEPKEHGNNYIVAVITEVREKGIAELEDVEDAIRAEVIKVKKQEMFAQKAEEVINTSKTIEEVASKLNLQVQEASNVNFFSTTIPGAGNEPAVVGAVSSLKTNTLSQPLAGKQGIFIITKEGATQAPELPNYKMQQNNQISQLQPRVDYEVYDALKNNANVVNRLVNFY